MSGSTNLSHLLASMSPDLHGETFVFVTLLKEDDHSLINPIMRFTEKEGITLIVTRSDAEAAGLLYEFPCRMITLNIHSSLEAVGFLAVITTHLAKLNIGVNPVSGFYHDHLFVPADRGQEVMKALSELSAEHQARPG